MKKAILLGITLLSFLFSFSQKRVNIDVSGFVCSPIYSQVPFVGVEVNYRKDLIIGVGYIFPRRNSINLGQRVRGKTIDDLISSNYNITNIYGSPNNAFYINVGKQITNKFSLHTNLGVIGNVVITQYKENPTDFLNYHIVTRIGESFLYGGTFVVDFTHIDGEGYNSSPILSLGYDNYSGVKIGFGITF